MWIFSIWIFFSKVIQKSHCYWVLAYVCTAPHAKQIREDLDEREQQAKATLPTGNCRTLPQRDRETAKNDESAFGSDALD